MSVSFRRFNMLNRIGFHNSLGKSSSDNYSKYLNLFFVIFFSRLNFSHFVELWLQNMNNKIKPRKLSNKNTCHKNYE